MASKQSKSLWEKAIPLNQAWIDFGPNDLRNEFQNLQNPNQWDLQSNCEKLLDRGLEIFEKIISNKKRKAALEDQLKDILKTALLDGSLVAFGFRELPSRSNGPVRIDTSISKTIDINWENERLTVFQTEYSRVGVLKLYDIESDSSVRYTNPYNKSNSENQIDRAIEELKWKIPNFGKRPRKDDCNAIIKHLAINPLSGEGYSYSKVSKALVRKFGRKRNASKMQ